MEVETLSSTLAKVKTKALFDEDTLGKEEAETLMEKLVEVKAEAVDNALADTLLVALPETLTKYWPKGSPIH